jgi:peptide/nickel transport system substrate-binding protein
VDDQTFRFRLTKPFPKMLYALGKSNPPLTVIMPERIANTDPFKLITEYIGSGPMKFAASEWVPGSLAVFTRFEGYAPRTEAADWTAGGKRMMFDRIEWHIMDPATAAGALQNGEIDWWENPLPDLVPLLKRNRNVALDIADPLGNLGSLRFNHLVAPFNDVRARRAVLMALSQEDYMRAVVGDDPALWKACPSFFTPGTSLYTTEGGAILEGPRKYDAAKSLLKEAGYNGEKVALMVATDVAITKAEGDVTADLLSRIGVNVDYQALDWGTVGARRTKKDPVAQGGWNIFHTWHAGADCINPAAYTALQASGDNAWFGWPKSDAVQAGIAEWYDAKDLAGEKLALVHTNKAAFDDVVYGVTGFFLGYQAWRKSLSGIVKAPFPVFWGVQKT